MHSIPVRLKRNLLNRAKGMAPIRTGNLRHNAIRGERWSDRNKFKIVYDTQSATYIEPLQEGWKSGNRVHNVHRGFIDRTVWSLASEFAQYFSDGKFRRKRGFSKKELLGDHRRIAQHAQSLANWNNAKRNFTQDEPVNYEL